MFLHRVYHYYSRDMKLKTKFMISHFILILVPTLIVSILLSQQLAHIIVENSIQSEQSLSAQMANSLEKTISQVQNASTNVSYHQFFTELLLTGQDASLYSQKEFRKSASNFINTVYSMIDGKGISDIKIYLDTPFAELYENPLYEKTGIFQPIANSNGAYWRGIFVSSDRTLLVCPSLYLTPRECRRSGELAVIRRVYYPGSPLTAAYVAVYFPKETIDVLLKKNISQDDNVTYLLNERDTLVAASNGMAGKYILRYEDIPEKLKDTQTFATMTFAGERTYLGYKEITGTDWYLVNVVPVHTILSSSTRITMTYLAIFLGFFGMACLVALQLSGSITRRISHVIHQMNLVRRNGTPSRLPQSEDHDEIGDLIDTYNFMTDEIHALLLRQNQDAEDLRKAEFKALQSQINPHFLYNTLDMINWLSKGGRSDEVCEAVQALSRFYKLTLNKGNMIVTVKEELEHVTLYMKLQNMRYQNKIHFFIDVPDEMLYFQMPKLIFQPLVENAIQYGILGKESKEGNIVITAWPEGGNMVFSISDDGIGIPEEKLETILDRSRSHTGTGSHVGIYNTHKRLQLFYNDHFGLQYHSIQNVETTVEIRIPAVESDESAAT